jgi:vitamin B12 transporter
MTFVRRYCGALPATTLFFASATAVANADEHGNADTDELETLVVTATRLPAGPAAIAASVTGIDEAELEQRYPASIVEALRQVPGIDVTQQGGRGGVTSVLVRGGESNFTAVFIDGVKVNDLTNTSGGSYEFSGLDLAGVSRIDVIRGPLSSIYGSDALAGAVYVVTDPGEAGTRASVETGTDGLASAGLTATGSQAGTDMSISVHATRDDSADTFTHYEDAGLHASLRREFAGGSRLLVGARTQQSEVQRFPQESGGALLAANPALEDVDNEESHLRASWDTPAGSDWRLRLAGSYYERNETIVSPGIAPGVLDGVPPSSTDAGFDRSQVVATAVRQIDDEASFLLGAEWQREQGTSRGILDIGFPIPTDFTLRRDSLGVFAEASVPVGAFVLQGSLRHDDIDAAGKNTSLRAGVLYRFADGITELRINAGGGFKAPSFFALAHPLIGNADLRPESADSVDVEYRRRFADGRGLFSLSAYRNEFTDLVDFDPERFLLVNRSRVVTDGIEMMLRLPLGSDIELQAHATHANSDIRGSDAQLRNRPGWRGGIAVDWAPGDAWTFSGRLLFLDEYFDSSIPTGMLVLEGYERVDIAATWRASERVTWRFALDNALDADYVEAVGFPAQGLRARAGIRLSF